MLADCPRFAPWRKARTRGSANPAMTCGVSSVEQSSTMSSSKSAKVCASTLLTARGNNAVRLCVGIMTLTLGSSATGAA